MRTLRVVFGVVLIAVSVFILSGCMRNRLEGLRSGYDWAIEDFKACVDRDGEDASWCSFMFGHDYFVKGHYPEAIKYFKKSIDIYDKHHNKDILITRLHYAQPFWLGRAYFENGQYKEAIAYLNKASSMAPENPASLVPEYAVVWKNDYLPLIPSKGTCYLWLGTAYYKDAHYQEAIEAYKKSIELEPSEAMAYRLMAVAHRDLKQFDHALTAAKKAIEVKPTGSAYFTLARIYEEKKQYADAIAAYKRAQEMDPDDADIPFAMGNDYMVLGKFDDAISSLNKAISLRTMTGVGMEIAIEENYPVVKKLWEGPAKRAGIEVGDRIIKIDGQSTKGWEVEKVTRALRGEVGTQVLITIKRKNLDNPMEKTVSREAIASKLAAPVFGLRSLAYRLKGNIQNAEKDAEKAYSLDPNDDTAKEALGAIYIDKGKSDDAIKILSTASKDYYFANLLKATAYAKNGGYKKAVEIYSSVPEDYLSSKSVLRQSQKKALLESLKPYIDNKKDTAKSLETKGQYREALNEYTEVLKVTDDKDAKEIRTHIATILKKNPYLSQIPEEARKYALRGEVMLKEGKFEEALKEYKTAVKNAPYAAIIYRATALVYAELKDYAQAINHMNTYLDLIPEAPDARAVKDQIYKWEFMLEKEKGEK
ncbi:MAG: tetratricopeptide repeat protein [Nitrospirota bacterium]